MSSRKRTPKRSWSAEIQALAHDETDLASVLGLGEAEIERLRTLAGDLFRARDWVRCEAALRGLAALGWVHPADALMLAHCCRMSGNLGEARAFEEHGKRLIEAAASSEGA